MISVGNIYTNVTLKYSCQLSSLAPHSLSYGSANWPKEQKANESWREHEKEDSTRVEVMRRVDFHLILLSFCVDLDLF